MKVAEPAGGTTPAAVVVFRSACYAAAEWRTAATAATRHANASIVLTVAAFFVHVLVAERELCLRFSTGMHTHRIAVFVSNYHVHLRSTPRYAVVAGLRLELDFGARRHGLKEESHDDDGCN